ncbi:MAG TPA: MFS transporter [Candidatus Binatia bacterium]|nr:MFS transporter [Candidatus Binatia bacterium]
MVLMKGRLIKAEVMKAAAWGLSAMVVLAGLIVIGSRNLSHFDAALIGYTFAVLFATFGITYRYAMWLQRPPTAMYWKRGWQVFFRRGNRAINFATWPKRVVNDIALNRFILRRGAQRWLAHWLIMWGCAIAGAITFPLVFGWIHFESVPGDFDRYRVLLFGFPGFIFQVQSVFGFIIFHGLVWSAFMVIAGVMLAMRRRMRDEGAAAVQLFVEDFLPLILLFAISITGLLLTASYTWMKGYAYDFLAIVHAVTVIFTLLWLPFGKFFHIFQRPAQLGVSFYKDAGAREEKALCRRCGHPFSSRLHVEDLIQVERELGYRYEVPANPAAHYQWICPPCRRATLALAQGRLWTRSRDASRHENISSAPAATPSYVNPGFRQGPLGEEDKSNFHP